MKIAVSLPDELFAKGEEMAVRLNLSRSQLYAKALADFVAKRDQQSITDRLTAVYVTESSALDPVFYQMQLTTLEPEQW